MSGASDLEIAVVGMACRFPGADTVEAFWKNLREGVESVSFFTEEELQASGVSAEVARHPSYVPAAAVLADVEDFDARFFGFSAREAQALDPQHRLFLELAATALERAACDPERYPGSIGVYAGCSGSAHYWRLLTDPRLREAVSGFQALLSTERDFLATRVAYKLDLRGPALTVQTACSTSLAAVHLACQSLVAGECDMALAGGVSVAVPQKVGYRHEPDGILSKDGHCRAFDAEASGTIKGSGVGLVVLKRLSDALHDGDHIHAVVKGWAMNNDAAHRVGFTAPGVEGQARVVRLAQAMAGVEPDSIGYVEAHGTGTALGDPIEVTALSQVIGARTERRAFCALGSVKSNIGHLDAAAGVAGLIKVVLMLDRAELVPSLHFQKPNPRIDFAAGPFYVSTRTAPWPKNGTPRRAGISAFGIGGTNVHLVLEEAPEGTSLRESAAGPARPEVLVLSARTASALDEATDLLAGHLRDHPELSLADVAYTLREGRRRFRHRRAVAAAESAEAVAALARRDPERAFTGVAPEEAPSLAFLFTGQGAQYPGMARGLYETQPVFRDEVDACCERLREPLGFDLREVLYADGADPEIALEALTRTRVTQPALFVVEHALARLWMSRGVVPEAMIGHSIGEYVAACLAGVMSRDEALGLVAERGRLMQACPRGAMLAVALSEAAVAPFLGAGLSLSVVNAPDACVVGGPGEAIDRLAEELRRADVPAQPVKTSHAFHSAMMASALAPFAARMAAVRLLPPRIPFVSNVTGTWILDEQATDPAYWTQHLMATVRFSDGLAELLRDPRRVLLEVGPGATLTSLARRQAGRSAVVLASLRHARDTQPDDVFLARTAARLWTAGVAVDATVARGPRRRVVLPTYPFERERYSLDVLRPATASKPVSTPDKSLVGKQAGIERWLYVPTWKRTEKSAAAVIPGSSWCVFAEEEPLGRRVVEGLRAAGAAVTEVRPGDAFGGEGRVFTVAPDRREDHERLLAALPADTRFVHLWGASPPRGGHGLADPVLMSVLHLAQGLGARQQIETALTVVSAGAEEVTGAESLWPERSAVLGLTRVASQEYPLVSCRHVDVDPAGALDETAQHVLAEAAGDAPETRVACRGRYRWVLAFEAQGDRPAAAPRIRPGGVYLITGGLGKVGLALATHLARTAQARLVLVGRSALPERASWAERLAAGPEDLTTARMHAVEELERLGAEVLTVSADAADGEAMRAAVEAARRRFGALHGIVHAAGDLGPGALCLLPNVERADFERQLRPKALGALAIDEVLGEERLDFVLLTSSLSTVLGGLGFAAYAAANHYLDAFARRQHQRGRDFWVSVDWDGWRFSSEAAGESELARVALTAEEGGAAFARVLSLGALAQVVVSTAPLAERIDRWARPSMTTTTMTADAGPDSDASLHARPDLHTVYATPETPAERRLAEIWGQLLGIDRVGVDDNFFELGGSSLLAIHLVGKVKKEFAADLSVATLFEAPTVRALGRIVSGEDLEEAGPGAPRELEKSLDRGQLRRQQRRGQRRTVDAAVE